jgi:poly-beta-1,6-N-acetyl-D-glucosamine synthase
MLIELLFWFFIIVIVYTYLGYGIVAFILTKIPFFKKKFFLPKNKKESVVLDEHEYLPKVTLIISAYSESRSVIREKIQNTILLNYPKSRLEVFFAVAIDKKKELDETLDEYYRYFLNLRVPTGLKSKTEELLTRFYNFNTIKHFKKSDLNKIINLLENVRINTSEIDLDYKNKLAMYNAKLSEKNDLKWQLTKDVERKGKISQVNRTIKKASGDIIVFSDANAMFNEDSIMNIVRHFVDSQVGCVAGEKRIKKNNSSTSGEGEGLYWKYESFLKKLDSKLYSTIGAAGEIFAVRRTLLDKDVPENAIIEDFVLSMKLVESGYKIVYEPEAFAEEEPTLNIKDEFKRRTRIAAGGFQSIIMLKKLFNFFAYRILSFQFISHRVLRWAVVPFILPLVFALNFILSTNTFYQILLILQILFYTLSLGGLLLELKNIKIKMLNIPFVFVMMNYSAYIGLKRFITGEQSVIWDKAVRVENTSF